MSDEIEIPDDLPRTVAEALERAARLFGDEEALVDGDVRLSWVELLAAVDEAARALVASGIEPGDRVAIWAPNMGEWAIAASAVHRAGAVLVPLNTRFKGPEAAYILNTSRARILFTVSDFLDTDYVALLGDVSAVPSVEEIVVLRGPTRPGTVSWADFLSRATSVPADAAAQRAAAIGPEDLSDILFTSGIPEARASGAPVRVEAMGELWRVHYNGFRRSEGRHIWVTANFLWARGGLCPRPLGAWSRGHQMVLLLERRAGAQPLGQWPDPDRALAAAPRPSGPDPRDGRDPRAAAPGGLLIEEVEGSPPRASLAVPHGVHVTGTTPGDRRERSSELIRSLQAKRCVCN